MLGVYCIFGPFYAVICALQMAAVYVRAGDRNTDSCLLGTASFILRFTLFGKKRCLSLSVLALNLIMSFYEFPECVRETLLQH